MTERYIPDEYKQENTCKIRHKTESGIYIPISENEPELILPFKEWKKTAEIIKPGGVITDVPPSNLFTTQDWLDSIKMRRAMVAQEELDDDAFTILGTIFDHPKEHMGNLLVILEGNHRTVNAANTGHRVNFQIVEKELSPTAQVWCIKNLIKQYGGMDR